MSFTDNPVISALGDQLGLGGVFAAIKGGGAAAAPAPAAPPAVKPGVTKPNIPNYRERPYIPRNETGSPGGGVRPGGGVLTPPGTMDPSTLQDPKVAALLGQYGVTPPSTPPNPNMFITNPEAYNRHPILAGLLEHGLGAAANSHEGSNWFQSLLGGIRGGQEYEAQRSTSYNNQLMAPFQQAAAVGGLQKMADEHAASIAEDAHKKAADEYYKSIAESKAAKAAQVAPRKNEDGSWSTWNPDLKEGEGGYEVNPDMGRDEEIHQKNSYFNAYAKELADKNHGGDLSALTHEELGQIHQDFETMQSRAKGAASIDNTKTKAAATIRAATIRGANGSYIHMAPGDGKQWQDLDKEETNIRGELNRAATNKDGFFFDDDGKMIVTAGKNPSKAYTDWLNKRTSRIAEINNGKKSIETKYGATSLSPGSPPLNNPNPFQHTPVNSNPFR